MDHSMPGIDGLEATRRLKAEPRTSHIPVLILTAFPVLAVQAGAGR
jgi:CheY-like chemotaxis protein